MASRRLSELLQEQQEPFLLLHGGGGATEAAPCYSGAQACRRRLLGGLCLQVPVNYNSSHAVVRSAWGRAARRALRRWDLLAGCFPCGGARESFRRLPRAGDTGSGHCDAVTEFDDDGARGGRQLSPVSVLDVLHSDDEDESSPMLSNWEDDKPSTSGSSPSAPSGEDLSAGATSPRFTFYDAGKIRATEAQSNEKAMTRSCKKSMEGEQTIISSWERIAGDITRIPVLVELDLSSSSQEWRRRRRGRLLGEEEEASRVVASVAAMIFEEMRTEAVRDMLRSHQPCWSFPV